MQAGLSQVEAEEMMGPRPPEPSVFVDTAWKATGTKARQTAPAPSGPARWLAIVARVGYVYRSAQQAEWLAEAETV